jgi:subtilisin-like proprotein convertase family protein
MELSNLLYTRFASFQFPRSAAFASALTHIPGDPSHGLPALQILGSCRRYEPGAGENLPDTKLFGVHDAIDIPNHGVASRSVHIPGPLLASNASVAIAIEHERIADLRITLTRNDGHTILVRDQKGEEGMFHFIPFVDLGLLPGLDVGGEWQLKVEDLAGGTPGKLRLFQLVVTN